MSPLIVFVCFRSPSDGLWRWHARSSRDRVLANGLAAFNTHEECLGELVHARQTLQIEPVREHEDGPLSAGSPYIHGQATGDCRTPAETSPSSPQPVAASIRLHRHASEVCVAPTAG